MNMLECFQLVQYTLLQLYSLISVISDVLLTVDTQFVIAVSLEIRQLFTLITLRLSHHTVKKNPIYQFFFFFTL